MSNQDKITAYFGADVSEVEAKMLTATRATKAYERAVQGISKADAGSGLARNLDKTNSLFGEISKKFTGGKILESVLGGVGLGGGFAIAEKAASMIAKYWEDAAKSAEAIATISQETTDYTLKRIGLRETDEQALAKAQLRSKRADAALRGDLKLDPEESARLAKEAEKAAYELEVLQKKAAERVAQNNKKLADEQRDREERDAKLKLDAFGRVKEQEDREADARKKAAQDLADIQKKAAEEKKKRDEEEQKRIQEIEQMEYDRTWRFATDQQKVAQVIKEGRAAQAKYDADASSENLLALEKIRKKYLDLMDTINGGKDGSAKTGTDGGRVRGGVKISAEDAARTDATSARNERLNQDALRNRIKGARQVGEKDPNDKTDKLLESIDKKLTATYEGKATRA